MDSPGAGISGVKRRIVENRADTSLNYPLSLRIIKPSHQYEPWISWRQVRHIAGFVKEKGVRNAGEWHRLAHICKVVSRRKKAFLYRELRHLFSPASLRYLFGDFHPMPWEVPA
jgi:hypothetical protein